MFGFVRIKRISGCKSRDQCKPYSNILALASALSDKADIVPGYDFLVNSVWPEMIRGIEERLSYLFNPGNPDVFYEVRLRRHSWCVSGFTL